MNYLIDTANLENIRHCNEFYPISGVTTNPTLISKENTDFISLIKEIRNIIGPAKALHCIKIPICEEGLKATMMLKEMGIKVTMTAIFTPAQALMAAKAGASYVAPYVNRLDNIIEDGVNVVGEIVKQFLLYHLDCQVLAASFKSCEQIHKCALAGCHNATIDAHLFKGLISHPMNDAAIAGFAKDWKSVYGDKSILDF